MSATLSFALAPPISAPLRYFLTAPLFGIATGLLLAWLGPQALASRWSPLTLGLTHLLALGSVLMVMIGALFQVLPVVAGVGIARPQRSAPVIHLALSAGTVALCAGLMLGATRATAVGVVLLAAAVAVLLLAAAPNALRAPGAGDTLRTLRYAGVALAATATLGVGLGVEHAWPGQGLGRQWTDSHAGWALAGWVGLLMAGVGYQVIPMFSITPDYPRWLTRHLGRVLLGALLAATLAQALGYPALARGAAGVAALALLVFAATTLSLLARRRRRRPDPGLLYWRASLASLIAAVTLWAAEALAGASLGQRSAPLLGVLMLAGFALSAINGMLQRIVPFLVWLQLSPQLRGAPRAERNPAPAPNVRQIIPERAIRVHAWSHIATLAALVGAALWPQTWTTVAGLALALSSGLLARNLLAAAALYRRLSGA